MASYLQKIPSGNESRAEGENHEMGIPNYRERSRLNYCPLVYHALQQSKRNKLTAITRARRFILYLIMFLLGFNMS